MTFFKPLPFAAALLPSLLLGMVLRLAAQTPLPPGLEQTLRANRGQKRILLVAAATAEQADFRRQKAQLAAQQAGLTERDFVVLEVLYNQLPAADQRFLGRQLGLRPPAFAVVLLGKDGGVKLRSARPLAPAALFGIVDQMPMRRQEMRRAAPGQ